MAAPLFPDPTFGACGGLFGQRVAAEAIGWIGTPYRHQGTRKGVGCDCLGLVRGVWLGLYGFRLPDPDPYAPDWAEASGAGRLLAELRLRFRETREEPAVGNLLLFRWRAHLPAKHMGILVDHASFIHAYEGGGGVVRSRLVPQWRRRIAAVFAFPPIASTLADRSI